MVDYRGDAILAAMHPAKSCPLFSESLRISERFANNVVLTQPERQTSYSELLALVLDVSDNILAHPPVVVAVLVDDPRNALVAIWAILACGNAYMPLSGEAGPLVNAQLIRQCNVRLMVTDRTDFSEIEADPDYKIQVILLDFDGRAVNQCNSPEPRVASASGHYKAYILTTSGTTGTPKLVVQNRANVAFHAQRYGATVGLAPGVTLTWFAHYGFDAACMDIFGTLLHGATLICPGFGLRGLVRTPALLSRSPANVFHSTPTVFRALSRSPRSSQIFLSVSYVVFGGEPAFAGDLQTFRLVCGPSAIHINGLGPSECSVALQYRFTMEDAARFLIEDGSASRSLPIGRPVNGIRARTMTDGTGAEELQLEGDGVFVKYLADAERTDAAFYVDGSIRWYRTGDLVAYDPAWGYVFRRRRDHAIKVRGQWIDPLACAAILRQDDNVIDAWVMLDDTASGENQFLTAFVHFKNNFHVLSPDTLSALPTVASGIRVRHATSVPLASNGKLKPQVADLKREPDFSELPRGRLTGSSVTTYLLAAEISVALDDDIFDAGLDSLTFSDLILYVQQRAGRQLDIDEFLIAPTVRNLLSLLRVDP